MNVCKKTISLVNEMGNKILKIVLQELKNVAKCLIKNTLSAVRKILVNFFFLISILFSCENVTHNDFGVADHEFEPAVFRKIAFLSKKLGKFSKFFFISIFLGSKHQPFGFLGY